MRESVVNELSNLYGESWFCASYYLLLKSESRESDKRTNYFYKGGREAATLYDLIGWDFESKDAAQKERYARDRARMIRDKNEVGYKMVMESEKRYEEEKALALRASRLGKFLGADAFRKQIEAFVLSEEKTPWFAKNREAAAQQEALAKTVSLSYNVNEKDILLLSALKEKDAGNFVVLALDSTITPEPMRFLGIEKTDTGKTYLLEHLREIGTFWSGTNSFMKNVWDNASHDGCLEVISVTQEEAKKIFVGVNSHGGYEYGRLEFRCMVSDFGRKLREKITGRKGQLLSEKPKVSYQDVLARYKVRKERASRIKEPFEVLSTRLYDEIVENQDNAADKVRQLADNSVGRLDALIMEQTRKQREEVIARYRMFSERPDRLAMNRRPDMREGPPLRLPVEKQKQRFNEL